MKDYGPSFKKNILIDKSNSIDYEEGGYINFKQIDEPLYVLLDLASTEQEEKVIIEYQHYHLLYRYRNYLIHESRQPGSSMEITQDSIEPYYHGYIGEKKLFLAYPIEMFVVILEKSVDYIKDYLEKHNFDPYDFVEETSRW